MRQDGVEERSERLLSLGGQVDRTGRVLLVPVILLILLFLLLLVFLLPVPVKHSLLPCHASYLVQQKAHLISPQSGSALCLLLDPGISVVLPSLFSVPSPTTTACLPYPTFVTIPPTPPLSLSHMTFWLTYTYFTFCSGGEKRRE